LIKEDKYHTLTVLADYLFKHSLTGIEKERSDIGCEFLRQDIGYDDIIIV
jgi:hypothetical protein